MRVLLIDHDHELGLGMLKEFTGIEWEFELGPKGHSKQERGVRFLAGRALRRFLSELKVDKVSSRQAKAAVDAELGEKLPPKTWQRLRDSILPSTGWTSETRSLIRT